MRRLPNVPATFAFILCLFVGQSTQAEQFVANLQGKEVVVHSNPLPVIFHRLIPPNLWATCHTREFRNGVRSIPVGEGSSDCPILNQWRVLL